MVGRSFARGVDGDAFRLDRARAGLCVHQYTDARREQSRVLTWRLEDNSFLVITINLQKMRWPVRTINYDSVKLNDA